MSFAAALVMIAQAPAANAATEMASFMGRGAPITERARASVRILKPVTLRASNGEIAQRRDVMPPQRSKSIDGVVWFEFS